MIALVTACVIGIVGAVLSLFVTDDAKEAPTPQSSDIRADATAIQQQPAAQDLFAVTIRKPTGPPRVATGTLDFHGNEISVGCATCHATRKPNSSNRTPADLNEFHGEMNFNHGKISCLSCHNSDDYDALKLADGSRVEFQDVMTLCAQCHGGQMKDYDHGAHGGMNGYWDLSRGPRMKNNCVDCHHPHSPQFPKMQPTFKPRDRFLNPHGNRVKHGSTETQPEPTGQQQ